MVISVRAMHHTFCPRCGFSDNRNNLARHAFIVHGVSLVGVVTDLAHYSFDITLQSPSGWRVHDVIEPKVADMNLTE